MLQSLEPRLLLALDSTFGVLGVAEVSECPQHDLALQPDGKLVAAGEPCGSPRGTATFMLARLLSNGKKDESFGTNSFVRSDLLARGATAIATQGDGKIVAAGSDGDDWRIVRFNPDGTLDTTFNDVGHVTMDFGGSAERATAVVVHEDHGGITVAGRSPASMLTLVRLRADGSFDPSFGDDGILETEHPSAADRPEDMFVLPGGRVLVHGTALYQFNSDGTADASFGGGDGVVPLTASPGAIAIAGDGNILLGGLDAGAGADHLTYLVLTRLQPDGSRDASFGGGDGEVREHVVQTIGGLAVRSDGTIYVGTQYLDIRYYPSRLITSRFAIRRYASDGSERGVARLPGTVGERPALLVQPDQKILAYAPWRVSSANNVANIARFSGDGDWRTPHEPFRPLWMEAEDFDTGGEGVAYHDRDARNRGGAYRSTGVDVEARTESGGHRDNVRHHVSSALAGEWIEYTIEKDYTSPSAGLVAQFRVASKGAGGTFHLEIDGVDVTGPLTVPDTGSWTTFRTISSSRPIKLSRSGEHVLRLVMGSAGSTGAVGNFDWLRLVAGLDTSFGDGGLAPGLGGTLFPQLLPYPDGSTMIVGGEGRLTKIDAKGRVQFARTIEPAWSQATAAVLQPDGKVLVAAHGKLRRFHRNGMPDETFAGGPAARFALQPDGSIIAGGAGNSALVRYRPDGSLDPTFAPETADERFAGTSAFGHIYLTRTTSGPDFYHERGEEIEESILMFVRRLRPDGSTDTTYGDNGTARILFKEDYLDVYSPRFRETAVLPNGSFAVGLTYDHYLGNPVTDTLILSPAPAAETIVYTRPSSAHDAFEGDHFLPRHDGVVAIAGEFGPYSSDVRPYYSSEYEEITGFGLHTPLAHLYGSDAIGSMAFHEDGSFIVSSYAGITKFLGTAVTQTVHHGRPWRAGEGVQFEDFDSGGQHVSYFDTGSSNAGGAYRLSRVDVATTPDAGGGFAVGWTRAREWLEYTVELLEDTTYAFKFCVANTAPGARFHVEINGLDLSGSIVVPDTGGWNEYVTIQVPSVPLPAGTHRLRIVFDEEAANGSVGTFNWFRFKKEAAGPLRVTGTDGDDRFILRHSGDSLEITAATLAISPWTVPLDQIDRIVVEGGAGNDSLWIEFLSSSFTPPGGLHYDAGPGTDDLLAIEGTANDDDFAVADDMLRFNDTPITVDGVDRFRIDGRLGNDALAVSGSARATLDTDSITLRSLTLTDSARLDLSGGYFNDGLYTESLSISGRATLDLRDAPLVLASTPATRDANLAAISELIRRALNSNPAWTGPGLTSTTLTTDALRTLAAFAFDVERRYVGHELKPDDIVVELALTGDPNLDGRVNADDYFRIDSSFISQPANPTYAQGDLNYDGTVNADDYFLIDSAFLGQGAALAAVGVGARVEGVEGDGGEAVGVERRTGRDGVREVGVWERAGRKAVRRGVGGRGGR